MMCMIHECNTQSKHLSASLAPRLAERDRRPLLLIGIRVLRPTAIASMCMWNKLTNHVFEIWIMIHCPQELQSHACCIVPKQMNFNMIIVQILIIGFRNARLFIKWEHDKLYIIGTKAFCLSTVEYITVFPPLLP